MAQHRMHVHRVSDRLVNVAVLALLLGIGLGTSLHSFEVDLTARAFATWWSGFWQNFSTEMYGAFLTFLLIEVLVGGREKRADEELQEAIADDLRNLMRGYIQGQEIARLRAVETQERRQPTLDAMKANDLLRGVNLSGAGLERADLSGADLRGADFRRADLTGANFVGANLDGAQFDEATTLPDGSHWTPDTDMARFTNP